MPALSVLTQLLLLLLPKMCMSRHSMPYQQQSSIHFTTTCLPLTWLANCYMLHHQLALHVIITTAAAAASSLYVC
jgi:ABC-type multidrug transport system permease subunit